jgi:hypothetical protein
MFTCVFMQLLPPVGVHLCVQTVWPFESREARPATAWWQVLKRTTTSYGITSFKQPATDKNNEQRKRVKEGPACVHQVLRHRPQPALGGLSPTFRNVKRTAGRDGRLKTNRGALGSYEMTRGVNGNLLEDIQHAVQVDPPPQSGGGP